MATASLSETTHAADTGPGFWRRFKDPFAPWDRRSDAWALAVLAVVTIATRVPFSAKYLQTIDSVLFALALDHYNVVAARPHAPGYPVYVAAGKLLAPLFADANAALVAMSVVVTTASVVLLYVGVREFGSSRAAFTAAFLFSMAPVLFYNSVIATSYAGESLFAAAVALAAWRYHRSPSLTTALIIGGLFALGVGYRQSLLFFLSPICAWAFVSRLDDLRGAVRNVLGAFVVSVGVALFWFVPMVTSSGGFHAYRAATGIQGGVAVFARTVFTHGAEAWSDLWPRFLMYVQWELKVLLPMLVMFSALAFMMGRAKKAGWGRKPVGEESGPDGVDEENPSGGPEPETDRTVPSRDLPSVRQTALFLSLWALPAVAFYLTVFNGWGDGPNGYILVFLPAVYMGYALVADAAFRRAEDFFNTSSTRRPTLSRFRSPLAVVVAVLLLVPAVPLVASWSHGIDKVRSHDDWMESWLGLKEVYSPDDVAIVSSHSWAFVKWYFPEYHSWSLFRIPGEQSETTVITIASHDRVDDVPFYVAHAEPQLSRGYAIPEGIDRVVLFDFQLVGENDGERLLHEDVQWYEEWLPNGWRILYFETDPERPMIEDYFVLE